LLFPPVIPNPLILSGLRDLPFAGSFPLHPPPPHHEKRQHILNPVRHHYRQSPPILREVHRKRQKHKSHRQRSPPSVIKVVRRLKQHAHRQCQRRRSGQLPDFRHQIRSDNQLLEKRIQQNKRQRQQSRMTKALFPRWWCVERLMLPIVGQLNQQRAEDIWYSLDQTSSMDFLSKAKRSTLMSRVRGQATKPELAVGRIARRLGYKFTTNDPSLPAKPDLAFRGFRKAIFVHGCFWHRHDQCKRASMPKTRVKFWQDKFTRNKIRDQRKLRKLRAQGWGALVVWECEIPFSDKLTRRIRRYLETR